MHLPFLTINNLSKFGTPNKLKKLIRFSSREYLYFQNKSQAKQSYDNNNKTNVYIYICIYIEIN